MHYKLAFPSDYVAACDLHEKDVTLTIKSVGIEEVIGSDGKKQSKPVLTFTKGAKRMVCCKTNCKSIAKKHGNEMDDWVGKTITIYPTTCQAFGETKECVRVR